MSGAVGRFNLRRPCAHCPFRTDRPGFLRRESAATIIDMLVRKDGTFACHETTVSSERDDGEMVVTDKSEHCAGATIMLEHMERPNQMMRICERLRMYDRTKLDMKAPVFKHGRDFIRHHTEGDKR